MQKKISEITNFLFKDIPYSQISENIKEKINFALENEYKKLVEVGQSSIQALGEIMHKYGTLENSLELVGVKQEELLDMKGKDSSLNKRTLNKSVRKTKLYAIFMAIGISRAIMYLIQGVFLLAPLYLISVSIDLAFVYLFFRLYRKQRRKLKYENICLMPEVSKRFDIYCDRHKKRFLNSMFILLGFIVNFTSIFECAIVANMNKSEIIVLITSNSHILAIGIFLFLYSLFILLFLLNGLSESKCNSYKRYAKKAFLICSVFLCLALLITGILKLFINNPFPVLYILTVLFIIIGFAVNYKKRVKLVIENIRINKIRIAAFSTAGAVALTVILMRKDVYVLEPYIMSVAEIEHTDHEIEYDDATGVYTINVDQDDFKILHLTDIHLGGSVNSSYKDYKALEACRKLIEHTKPDFVIVTGDLVFPMGIMSLSLNNEAPVRQFAAFMRNIGIPWAFTYGNHDTENMATGSKTEINELYKSLSFKSSGKLLYPYIQPEITGRSNQLIKIQNPDGSIRQALFLIDSNDYTGSGINDYDFIHDDQVNWYSDWVKKLCEEQGEIVPSMLFFHIPLQEYRTAYDLYQQGSSEVKYYFGVVGETMIDPICCSNYPSKLFDTSVELGSTRAMFCGHDHYNNISMEYKGIRLTYGMSIDYLAMPGIDNDTEQRGAELITIHPDSRFDIEQIKLTTIE